MHYRWEIDGLRAIAIIPVILFHAGFQLFSGGFIGVDIFFVISGYLITTIIFDQLSAKTFSLSTFYERRARRILPALLLVIIVSIPFAWMWLMPSDMRDFSKSIGFVLASFANAYFYQQSGYFSSASELKPLLHTWSLGIEEQYYWLLPLMLIGFWKYFNKYIFAFLLLISLLSFFYATELVSANPEAAFFLLPSRVWELLVGSVLAILLKQHVSRITKLNQYIKEVFSLIGLLLIVFPIFIFTKEIPYPSVLTLIPIVGTSLVIIFASELSYIGKLLSHKFLVGIGLISYSTYLWHQPLLAFARHRSMNEPSEFIFMMLALLSLFLGYLSWNFVEKPFRDKTKISSKNFFIIIGLVFSLLICFGLKGYQTNGFPKREYQELLTKTQEQIAKGSQGPILSNNNLIQQVGIYQLHPFGDLDAKKTIYLYGDSHAGTLVGELDRVFKLNKIKGVSVIIPDECEPIPFFVVNELSQKRMHEKFIKCSNAFAQLLTYINKNNNGIIVASRWTEKFYPIPGAIEEQEFNNQEGGVELDLKRKAYLIQDDQGQFTNDAHDKTRSINRFIDKIASLQTPIYLVYPIPEIGWNVSRVNAKELLINKNPIKKNISVSFDLFKSRNLFINNLFDQIEYKNIYPIKSESIFCNTFIKNRCVAQFNGVSFYSDDDHLSQDGSRLLVEEIMKKII